MNCKDCKYDVCIRGDIHGCTRDKCQYRARTSIWRRIIDVITYPFAAISALIDESRRINEDGSWDKYNERRNRKQNRNG